MRDQATQQSSATARGGSLSRRQFVQRLALVGLGAQVAGTLLAACSTATPGNPGGGAAPTSTTAPAPTVGGTAVRSASTPVASGQSFKGKTLVVTSYGGSWEEFMRKQVLPDFETRTGAKVELAVGLSKDWMTKLRAAGKDNPPYDVVIANETYISTARIEGSFIALPESQIPNLKDVHPKLKMPDNVGVLALLNPLGIAYMTEKVTSNPPKRWVDLKNFTGKLGIYNASNSACAQHIMMMAKIETGDYKKWETGFDWIKNNLKPNKQTDFSGDMEKLLTTGEVDVGILDSPSWARLSQQGVKMAWVAPEEGLFMFEQNTNVTAGSKVKDLAFAFVDYFLSEPVQTKFAQSYWVTPSNTKVKIGGDLAKLIPITADQVDKIEKWDYTWLNSGPRDQMINRWNREMTS